MEPQTTPPVQQFQPQPIPPRKSHKALIIAIVAGILILAGAALAYTKLTNNPAPSLSPTASATPDATASWKTYANTQYGFSFKYPPTFEERPLADYQGEQVIVHFEVAAFSQGITVSIANSKLDPARVEGFYGPITPTRVLLGNQVGYGYFDGDAGCSGFTVLTPYQGKTLIVSSGSCEDGDVPTGTTPVFGYPFSNPNVARFFQGFHFTAPAADAREMATRAFLYYRPESNTLLNSYNPATKEDRHNILDIAHNSSDFSLSPDTTLIAYVQVQSDVVGSYDVFLKNIITGNVIRLTEKNDISSYDPRFSADSQWVCYNRQVQGKTPENWAINISGDANTSKKVPENFCLAN